MEMEHRPAFWNTVISESSVGKESGMKIGCWKYTGVLAVVWGMHDEPRLLLQIGVYFITRQELVTITWVLVRSHEAVLDVLCIAFLGAIDGQ